MRRVLIGLTVISMLGAAVQDRASLEAEWIELEASGQAPVIDFEREAVIRATTFGSSSCPLHPDGVEVDERTVRISASMGFWMGCTADAVPYTFVVAVQRERLGATSFAVIVEADEMREEVPIPSS